MKTSQIILIIALFTTGWTRPSVADQEVSQNIIDAATPIVKEQLQPRHPAPVKVDKSPGHYLPADWADAIDSTWGPGLDDSTKQSLYTDFWNVVDTGFTCFHNVSVDWDSVWNVFWPEIEAGGVSKGRFSAILSHSALVLKDFHCRIFDISVFNTELAPGVPLMFFGGWGGSDHFGAGLTALEDKSLLVYGIDSSQPHPLGIVPGDIILGYDGIAYKDLYPQLIAAELPMVGHWWGASDESYEHSMLIAAGMNWHLFDTIDYVQLSTGNTLHLPTSLLHGADMTFYETEQLSVPGVPKPDLSVPKYLSWGVVDGTTIGYIYVWGFPSGGIIDQLFYQAVDSLMHHVLTTGMIIDFRYNSGGSPTLAHDGLELLFNETSGELSRVVRASPDDHLIMTPATFRPPDFHTVYGDTSTFYDKPIAMLTGPGAKSAGDIVAFQLSFHPRVKAFGKPTAGDFSGAISYTFHSDFALRRTRTEAELTDNPGTYLTHTRFPDTTNYPWLEFEEVWLTPENVAAGIDDVVEAAKTWIESQCCSLRGNIDHLNDINIADLVYLVDYMFNGGPTPPCRDEANIDGLGELNIADLVYLVDYMFSGGPAPSACL